MNHSRRQQACAYGLPITVLIIVPLLIMLLTNDTTLGWNLNSSLNTPIMILGLAAILSGLTLLVFTIRMFSRIGKGTLAPWAPTEELVVEGLRSKSKPNDIRSADSTCRRSNHSLIFLDFSVVHFLRNWKSLLLH